MQCLASSGDAHLCGTIQLLLCILSSRSAAGMLSTVIVHLLPVHVQEDIRV